MVPHLNKKQLKKYMIVDGKQAIQTDETSKGNPAIDVDEQPTRYTQKPKRKHCESEDSRRASSANRKITTPSGQTNVILSAVPGSSTSTPQSRPNVFQHFRGPDGEAHRSIWDKRFPTRQHIDAHLLPPQDQERYRTLNTLEICRAAATIGLRCASMMRWVELECVKQDKNVEGLRKQLADPTGDLKNVEILKGTVASLEEALKKASKEKEATTWLLQEQVITNANLKTEKEKVETDLESLKVDLKKAEDLHKASSAMWQNKEEAYENELLDFKKEVAAKYREAFHNAREQILCLHPGLDISGMDMFKEVHDGAIVEPEGSDENEEE